MIMGPKLVLVHSFVAAVVTVASLFATLPALAHQYSDFDQTIGVTISANQVTLEYRLWFGPVLIPLLGLDRDKDNRVTEEEMYRFLQLKDLEIQANLDVRLNNGPLVPSLQSATISASGEYPSMSVDMALWYVYPFPDAGDHRHALRVEDNNFSTYGFNRKNFFLNTASKAGDIRVSQGDGAWTIGFTRSNAFALASGEETVVAKAVPSNEVNRLTAFLHSGRLGPGMLMTVFFTAFVLGAAHGLSPGHGKAMVAAFLVGTRGRKQDAVKLGVIVTFTHVISVIILGIFILYLSSRILPEQLYPWLAVVSGILIFVVGIWMLIRQVRAGHHHHDHKHTHGHESAVSFGSLLSMGIAGGMVPCPSAIVVLLASVSLQKIALGLGIIMVFSLGLASVLILIGLAVVSVSGLSASLTRLEPLIRRLPLVSAVIIMIMGLGITANALVGTGVVTVNGFSSPF